MTDPHATQPIYQSGAPLQTATAALILLHGRGASAADILSLGTALAPPGFALLAPEAANNTWYPNSFLAPRAQNEPFLSSALSRIETTIQLALAAGIPADRIALCGFSQGACLSTEFVARNPRRYLALLAYTGALIGPLDQPITLAGSLLGTPVLLSSGDPDPHIPWQHVQQSADLLTAIGAHVTTRRYPGRPHTVLQQEIEDGRALLQPAHIG